jgi:hypothetical protein
MQNSPQSRRNEVFMRRSAILSIGFAAAIFASASAGRALAASETVTGTLVDLQCYSLNKAETGSAHRRGTAQICAQACAREGFTVGLLTSDGKVYEVKGGLAANINAKLVPHMSHNVTITGDVTVKDGVSTITADDLKMNGK